MCWPTAKQFELECVAFGVTPQDYFYAASNFSAAEHGGSHVDAPTHFSQGPRAVDAIPVERLIGPGVVVNETDSCLARPDYLVTFEDLTAWEETNGPIPASAIVLLRTDFGRFRPNPVRDLGTDERGAAAIGKLHFPGLRPEAATWLAASRSIGAVGLDTASIDHGLSTNFEAHVALFEHDVPALKNVANLHVPSA